MVVNQGKLCSLQGSSSCRLGMSRLIARHAPQATAEVRVNVSAIVRTLGFQKVSRMRSDLPERGLDTQG